MELSDRQNFEVSDQSGRFGTLRARSLLSDVLLATDVAYRIVRLAFDRDDPRPTYRYGRALQRMSVFHNAYCKELDERPALVEFWSRPRLFLESVPSSDRLASCSPGTLGAEYKAFLDEMGDTNLMDLRSTRLSILPDDALALEPVGDRHASIKRMYDWILARRNLFTTSTHDLCHIILGAPTNIPGEALVQRYQFKHLLVPQNWMNMRLSQLSMAFNGSSKAEKAQLGQNMAIVDKSKSYAELDLDAALDAPLETVRERLDIPADGLMR